MNWPRLQVPSILRRWWVSYGAAICAVAGVSFLIALIEARSHIANVSMLYLIAVLAIASFFGSGPAVLASIMAFLAFDWLFVKPYHTFTVADPEEWVALLLFLLTAIITGQLAAGQRHRAEEAEHREREATVLYDVVRLMSDPDLDHALHAVAERLRLELRLAAVVIEIGGSGFGLIKAAVGDHEAIGLVRPVVAVSARVLGEGLAPTAERRGAPGRWVRVIPPHPAGSAMPAMSDRLHVVPIRNQERRLGSLHLVRSANGLGFNAADDRLLSTVATQIATAVDRARLQQEATEAEILRRTDELKTALLNAVSHDLRTPLASIIASAGSLRQKDVSWTEREREEFTEAIEQEAERLNRIVGNLLDLSRMEAGSLHPETGWYDLTALIDDVLGRLRSVTSQHHVMVDLPEDLPPVLLDYVEIDQVLSNLIENAAKYAPPGTEIRVAARRVGQEVEVEVADRGPGIPQFSMARLFEPFYRGEVQGPRPKGTGLGLAVAKGLIVAHGGRIWAETRKGGGMRFVFTLPLATTGGAHEAEGEQQT